VKLTGKLGIQLPKLYVQVSARCFREMIICNVFSYTYVYGHSLIGLEAVLDL